MQFFFIMNCIMILFSFVLGQVRARHQVLLWLVLGVLLRKRLAVNSFIMKADVWAGLFIMTLSKAPSWDKIDDQLFFYNCLFAGLASISHMDDEVQIDQEALLVTCSNREGYQIREGSKILDLVIFGPHFGFWLKGDIIIQLDIQEDEKVLLPFWGVLQNKTVTSCYGTAKDYPNSLDLTS